MAGSGREGNALPTDDCDLCVIASSLNCQQPRSQVSARPLPNRAGTAPFPDLRRRVLPSHPPLLQPRVQSYGKPATCATNPPSRAAPCAGQLIPSSTKAQDGMPDPSERNSSNSSVNSSKDRAATTELPSSEGRSGRSWSELGRVPGSHGARAGGLRGRAPKTLAGTTLECRGGDASQTDPTSIAQCSRRADNGQGFARSEQLVTCKRSSSGLTALSEDVLFQICEYMHEKDIVRLSTASPAAFDERLWQQLHVVRYGSPNNSCLEGLPFAHSSKLQLQSDFPIHHSRLFAIRCHHRCIRSMAPPNGSCCSRLVFAAEALTREDRLLRGNEETIRLDRADLRRKQHSTRASVMRELAVAKRTSTEERMALVDVRSAVERHAYAPGCRPKAPQTLSSWREGRGVRAKGRASGASRILSPTLTGVFDGV
ncbi:unnamed protein product [Ectocarpus sp. 12 AP-2014]